MFMRIIKDAEISAESVVIQESMPKLDTIEKTVKR